MTFALYFAFGAYHWRNSFSVDSEFATLIDEFSKPAFSYFEYHFAPILIAKSLGFRQIADSPAFAARITPSFSPNQDPWSEQHTGAILLSRKRISLAENDANGK